MLKDLQAGLAGLGNALKGIAGLGEVCKIRLG